MTDTRIHLYAFKIVQSYMRICGCYLDEFGIGIYAFPSIMQIIALTFNDNFLDRFVILAQQNYAKNYRYCNISIDEIFPAN